VEEKNVKLRSYLLLANGISIIFILISLFISYLKMYLSLDATVLLSTITLVVAVISFLIHFFMTRPIEQSILRITQESRRIAEGDFQVAVPAIGPVEFQLLATQFNEMSKKLEESFQQIRTSEVLRRELVANVSHDLRTPMAAIQSFVEALQDDIINDEQTFQRYLATIRLETKRLNLLIDDLFELSRLESGGVAFEPQAAYLDDLILETLESQTIQIEDKHLLISVDLPDRLPPVSIMSFKMKNVLANLLQNAIRYSPKSSQIRIWAVELDEYIKVAIQDQGEGIDLTEQSRIFERFYRTDKSRNREKGGAGLGLAIVKSTVELHGGRVGVESEPGKGSCFWFTVLKYK
jgi:signal transduction histidine kinase